jgi:TrmH family RNA methyltransferase
MITSQHNPKIKAALKLKERRDRDRTGLFLIEGYRELKRAVDANIAIHSLFFCPPLFLGVNEPVLIEAIAGRTQEIYPCEERAFAKLSYRDRPDGLIAVAHQMKHSLADLKGENLFVVIAEGIEKPGNLGTILRSADAAGCDAVIVCDRCTDIYNPNVVRASVGTLFTIPVIEAGGKEICSWLQEKKIQIVAATPSAEEVFTETDLRGALAIAVGTEQLGLSELWMSASDRKVKIPMKGVADSLNVATATTLLLYEAVRQRERH